MLNLDDNCSMVTVQQSRGDKAIWISMSEERILIDCALHAPDKNRIHFLLQQDSFHIQYSKTMQQNRQKWTVLHCSVTVKLLYYLKRTNCSVHAPCVLWFTLAKAIVV